MEETHMEFCPKCGERLPGGVEVCPYCGTGLRGEKKPGGRRAVWIAAACAGIAVLAVLAAVLIPRLMTSPRDQFVSGQKQLVDQAVERITAAAEEYNAFTELSTDMTLTAACSNTEAHALLRNSSLELKVDLADSLLVNGSLTVMGSRVLTAALTWEDGRVGLQVPEADPNYYVADAAALAETLGLGDLDGVSGTERSELPAGALPELADTYFDILSDAATKGNVKRAGNQVRLEALDRELQGPCLVFTPTAEDLENMLGRLADQLETDQELRWFLTGLTGGSARLAEELTGLDLSHIDASLIEAAGDLRVNAGAVASALADAGFTWTLGLPADGGVLEKLELDGGARSLVLEAAEGRAALYASGFEDAPRLELEYRENGGLLEGSLISTEDGETATLRFEGLNPDKKSVLGLPYGVWTLEAEGETFTFTVKAGEDGGTMHTIALPDPGPVVGVSLGRLEIRLHTTDRLSTAQPPTGEPVDISHYSQEQLGELYYTGVFRLLNAQAGRMPGLLG